MSKGEATHPGRPGCPQCGYLEGRHQAWHWAELLHQAQAERDALKAALEWALDEGGWRLWYYAVPPLPAILHTPDGVGSPAELREDWQAVAALATGAGAHADR